MQLKIGWRAVLEPPYLIMTRVVFTTVSVLRCHLNALDNEYGFAIFFYFLFPPSFFWFRSLKSLDHSISPAQNDYQEFSGSEGMDSQDFLRILEKACDLIKCSEIPGNTREFSKEFQTSDFSGIPKNSRE